MEFSVEAYLLPAWKSVGASMEAGVLTCGIMFMSWNFWDASMEVDESFHRRRLKNKNVEGRTG